MSDRTEEALAKAAKEGEEARLNVGARAIDAFERPYACKIAGIPLFAKYDMNTLSYTFRFSNPLLPSSSSTTSPETKSKADTRNPPLVGAQVLARETEIYLPRRRYAGPSKEGRLRVLIGKEDGDWKYDAESDEISFDRRLDLHVGTLLATSYKLLRRPNVSSKTHGRNVKEPARRFGNRAEEGLRASSDGAFTLMEHDAAKELVGLAKERLSDIVGGNQIFENAVDKKVVMIRKKEG
ncbi:hypothetical protein P7C70_g7622, partial [Phenoliferia sp. Uapishka_3]